MWLELAAPSLSSEFMIAWSAERAPVGPSRREIMAQIMALSRPVIREGSPTRIRAAGGRGRGAKPEILNGQHKLGSELVDTSGGDLLDGYREWVSSLPIQPSVRRDRIWRAGRFMAAPPDPVVWMGRPTRARLADLHRVKAWPFATWLFVTGRAR
jgi:hypothetical protein